MLHRFRWVFCQLEMLRYCLASSIRRSLHELPETLDETYERILRDIHKTNRNNARRLLQCLTVASRPLRLQEVAEILAFNFDGALGRIPKLNTDWRWRNEEQAVLSTCSSLITVTVDDAGSRVVQFSHFSVKEFLSSPRLASSMDPDISRYHITLEVAHTILAQSCLGALLCLDDKDSVDNLPLAEYAAQHWVEHAQFGNVSSRVRDGMEDLFDLSKPHLVAWLQVHYTDGYWDGLSFPYPIRLRGGPLYYASLFGFYELAAHLIVKHPEQVNAIGGRILSPLLTALHRNHFRIAELLYLHGAVVDISCLWERTPLHAASLQGNIDTVRWLLDHGADANSRQDDLWTPLHLTAWRGRPKVARALLERNADIHSRSDDGRAPLHMASEFGHPDVVQLFLEHGADMYARDDEGSTPLHLASSNGRIEVVRLLLEHGVNPDVEDIGGLTPFQIASYCGRDEIARLLTEHRCK